MARLSMLKRKLQGEKTLVGEKQAQDPPEAVALPSQEAEGQPEDHPEPPAMAPGPPQESSELKAEAPQGHPEPEDQEQPKDEGPEPVDGIMSIFVSEEVEDLEFQALVEGLEDIDIQDLLRDCRAVANQLRREASGEESV